VLSSISSPISLESSFRTSSIRALIAIGLGFNSCFPAEGKKAMSNLSSPICRTKYLIHVFSQRIVAVSYSFVRRYHSPRLPLILLKSCAIPPARSPTASIFWAWISCASSFLRSVISEYYIVPTLPCRHIYIRVDILTGLGFYQNIIVINNAFLVQILHERWEVTHIEWDTISCSFLPMYSFSEYPSIFPADGLPRTIIPLVFSRSNIPSLCGLKNTLVAFFRFC